MVLPTGAAAVASVYGYRSRLEVLLLIASTLAIGFVLWWRSRRRD